MRGQRHRSILFATAPKDLNMSGSRAHALGKCTGWHPAIAPKRGVFGYTNDDIFYLEVCIFSKICTNGHEIFTLDAGSKFTCEFSADGFSMLEHLIRQPAILDVHRQRTQCTQLGPKIIHSPPSPPKPSCSKCWEIHKASGDCTSVPGCNAMLCDFCKQ